MPDPQPCPQCSALATDREKHRREHVRTEALAARVADLERLVSHHHPAVEGQATVDLHARERAERA